MCKTKNTLKKVGDAKEDIQTDFQEEEEEEEEEELNQFMGTISEHMFVEQIATI